MNKSPRKAMTLAEHDAWMQEHGLLEKFKEDQAEKERLRLERAARIMAEEKPLLDALREVGWNVQTVWDLVNTAAPYPEAIPVLLKYLLMPNWDVIKDGIARSLAVPDAQVRKAWPLLVDEYCKAPTGLGIIAPGDTVERRLGAKDGLACALAVAVTDETLPELIALAKDTRHGKGRLLLLSALKKRRKKNQHVQAVLEELAHDPDLINEISSWRR